MLVSIIRIGNSKGIRLPKALLEQCEIDNAVELEVKGKEIVLRPTKKRPREDWEWQRCAMRST
jgi:antitoxin MazE